MCLVLENDGERAVLWIVNQNASYMYISLNA